MAINFYNEKIKFDLKRKDLHKRWIRECIVFHKRKAGHLSFIFTSNEHIRSINRKFLNHNYFTDVITFDYTEGVVISGDCFISVEKVKENAKELGEGFEAELRRVMIHGVLHLLGFNDKEEEGKRIMLIKENEALNLWVQKSDDKRRI